LVGNDQENHGFDGEIRTLQQINQLSENLVWTFTFNLFGGIALNI
jgi:hypothetical protein